MEENDTPQVEEAPSEPTLATPEPAPAPEAPAQPESDPVEASFDVSAWDGSVDSLPEEYRPVAKRYEDKIAQYEADVESMESVRKLYQELIEGHADPRVPEYEQKISTLQTERDEYSKKFEEYRKQLENEQKRAQAILEKQAEENLTRYQKEHEWLFDGGETEAAAVELLKSGWSPDQVPIVMKLRPKDKERAIAQFNKNPHAGDEILMWISASGTNSASDGAELVSGATTPQISSPVAEHQDKPNLSRREQIEAIAAAKMKRAANKPARRS